MDFWGHSRTPGERSRNLRSAPHASERSPLLEKRPKFLGGIQWESGDFIEPGMEFVSVTLPRPIHRINLYTSKNELSS